MRLLLDTVAFIWLAEGHANLSGLARRLIADPANEVYLSAASAWEISIKHGLGRLRLPPKRMCRNSADCTVSGRCQSAKRPRCRWGLCQTCTGTRSTASLWPRQWSKV